MGYQHHISGYSEEYGTWYFFMFSSANAKCVENLASSFWCWGIFLIICERSRIFDFPSVFMRFSWLNFFSFLVTFCDTTAMCWCRISTHKSSFSSSNTSLICPSEASYLSKKVRFNYFNWVYVIWKKPIIFTLKTRNAFFLPVNVVFNP